MSNQGELPTRQRGTMRTVKGEKEQDLFSCLCLSEEQSLEAKEHACSLFVEEGVQRRGKEGMTSASEAWCPVSQEHLIHHGAHCPLPRKKKKWEHTYHYSSSWQPISIPRWA